MLNIEVWKPVTGYEGLYEVSSEGRVRNSRQKVLKLFTMKSGYQSIKLFKDTVRRGFLVHRLCAEAFLDNPNRCKTVNHKDGVKGNNSISNLEWSTYSENLTHKCRVLGKYNKPTVGMKLVRSGKPPTSKFKGVCFCKTRKKFVAALTLDGKRLNQKRFDNELDAAKYYDKLVDLYRVSRPKNFN